ncbi:AAA family ATPase [Bradyrhizobium sp. STM 3809]|uniref:AAA family ATPase n=1 Tax=Bradyrhizobium sp. STM 3809 TaxID=551936 RepID=UPI0002406548|nr:AAA family ATPase [Bradyrhizobium sp. STM 3809]CCD97628.1 putative Endonuclease relaxase (conjugal protein trA-like) [Bradyrhizobium sp. STM 3809]
MIPKILKGQGLSGLVWYGAGRDRNTGKLTATSNRSELLGGNMRGFGFEVKDEKDVELARCIMEWAALPENQASRTKPCVKDAEHIILSWAKGQTPDRAEKIEACEGILDALGMANARALYFAHHDTDHVHVHIIASRIDPETGKTYSAFEDRHKAIAWSLKWERERNQITAEREETHRMVDAFRAKDFEAARALLTEKEATFERRDVERYLAWADYHGEERNALRSSFLGEREVVALREEAEGPVKAYTTREVLAEERGIMEHARALRDRSGFALKPETIEAMAKKYTLSDEQRRALAHIGGDEGFAIIAGQAGTGKSRVLQAAREGWELQGNQVRGLAFTNKVVANLRRDGFTAQTLSRESKIVAADPQTWRAGTVLMVDEMAMLSHKNLEQLLRDARDHDVKIINVGDDRQLGSIDRGGMFTVLREEFGAAEITEVRRVSDADQKRAFGLMHGGKGERDFESALKIFEEKGAIHWGANRGDAVRKLGAKYIADIEAAPDKRRLMLAMTNEEVQALNLFARNLHRERGELGEDHALLTAKGEGLFASGDRIVVTGRAPSRAATDAGLVNGAFGRLDEITLTPEGKREITLTLDGSKDGQKARFRFVVGDNREAGEFNAFAHGYASTVYKSQGDTLDQVYDLHSPVGRANSNYVAKTRHAQDYNLFVAQDQTKDFDELVRQTSRGGDKIAATSYRYQGHGFDEAAENVTRPPEEDASAMPPGASTPLRDVKMYPGFIREVLRDAASIYSLTSPEVEEQHQPELKRPRIADPLPDPVQFAREPSLGNVIDLGAAQKKAGKTVTALREVFKEAENGKAYVEALRERGFYLAGVDGLDARESEQRREDAKEVKGARVQPLLKEGGLVAINRYGTIYQVNAYMTGAKIADIEAKLADVDRAALPNVKDAYALARADAAERAAEAALRRDPQLGSFVRFMDQVEKEHGQAAQPKPVNQNQAVVEWRREVAEARARLTHDQPFIDPSQTLRSDAAREERAAAMDVSRLGKAGHAFRGAAAAGKQAAAGMARVLDGVAKWASAGPEFLASAFESIGLSPKHRAFNRAKEEMIREAAPSRREIAEAERAAAHKESVARDQEQKTQRAQDPQAQRYADAARRMEQFLDSEREQGDEGRTISRDRGSGSR